MLRRLCILVGLFMLAAGTASAQAVDARKALEASAKTMGATNLKTLYQNMLKLKSDVAQHVPIHGHVGTNDEFVKIVTKTP